MPIATTVNATQAEPVRAHGEPVSLTLTLSKGYAFRVDFDDPAIEPLHTDERRPLGNGDGPPPSALLAAAVANCLAASLLFCLRKARTDVTELKARATVHFGRNARGRQRITRIAVELEPRIAAAYADQLKRCASLFEDYCTVTASVRDGLDIAVSIASAG
jgi:uncharacterized OsmC-like protein